MSQKLRDLYRQFHWGTEPIGMIDTISRHHSNKMVGYGRVCEFYIASEQKKKKQNPEFILEIPEPQIETSYLLFDSAKKYKPLMIELDPATQKKFLELYQEIPVESLKLKELAKIAGGYQSKRAYPNINAKPIGYCIDVVYRTIKKSDGLSNYIHAFGEPYRKGETWSEKPILAVDKTGEVFFCGGNYKCEIEGIIN